MHRNVLGRDLLFFKCIRTSDMRGYNLHFDYRSRFKTRQTGRVKKRKVCR